MLSFSAEWRSAVPSAGLPLLALTSALYCASRAALSSDDSPLPPRRAAAAAAAAKPGADAGGRLAAAAGADAGGAKAGGARAAEPPVLLLTGKRRRGAVDYRALNDQLFDGGMFESYAGELDDGDCEAPGGKRARAR